MGRHQPKSGSREGRGEEKEELRRTTLLLEQQDFVKQSGSQDVLGVKVGRRPKKKRLITSDVVEGPLETESLVVAG